MPTKDEEFKALRSAEQALQACGERSLCYFELGLVGMAIVSPTQGCLEVNDRLCTSWDTNGANYCR